MPREDWSPEDWRALGEIGLEILPLWRARLEALREEEAQQAAKRGEQPAKPLAPHFPTNQTPEPIIAEQTVG